jgi:hypothetical protein
MVRLTNCKYYEITPFLTSDEDKSKELSCATAMVIVRQFEGKPIVYKYYYEAVLNIICSTESSGKEPILLFQKSKGSYILIGKYEFKEDCKQSIWVSASISQAEQDIALKYIIKCKDNSKHGIL